MTATQQRLKNGDFVRIRYTGRIEGGRVIDTTEADVAEKAEREDVEATGPKVIVLGQEHIFDPVEDEIKDSGIGGTGEVRLEASEAFGEADPNRRARVDVDEIHEEEVGASVRYRGESGFIERVEDGEAVINFNHPLAGTPLAYEFEVVEKVTDTAEKAEGVIETYLNLNADASVEVEDQDGDDVVVCSLEEPVRSVDGWESMKTAFLDDIETTVDVSGVRIEESYGF